MKSSTIVIEPRQVVRILGFIKDSFARHWTILAFIFLYLSLDEAASLHEQLIKPMRRLLGEDGLLAEGEALHGI